MGKKKNAFDLSRSVISISHPAASMFFCERSAATGASVVEFSEDPRPRAVAAAKARRSEGVLDPNALEITPIRGAEPFEC